MATHIGLAILALSFAIVTGCHVGCCSKRASEKKCPTDIRKTHCWCFGEDALFRYPCGPNRVYYGHKATCWREWPTSGPHWRDVYCGPTMSPGVMPDAAELFDLPGDGSVPADGEVTDSFRGEAGLPDSQEEAAFTALDRVPAQPQKSTAKDRTRSAVATAQRNVVTDTLPPGAAVSPAPKTEGRSRRRLVVHDKPDGATTDNRVNVPLFRPPSFSGSLTRMTRAQHPAPPIRSLEEETGHAWRRSISFDIPPGAN